MILWGHLWTYVDAPFGHKQFSVRYIWHVVRLRRMSGLNEAALMRRGQYGAAEIVSNIASVSLYARSIELVFRSRLIYRLPLPVLRPPHNELPPRTHALNGHVERNNGARRYEFSATWVLPGDNLEDINRWIAAVAGETSAPGYSSEIDLHQVPT